MDSDRIDKITLVQPPEQLLGLVLSRIRVAQQQKQRQDLRQIAVLCAVMIASFASIVFTGTHLIQRLTQSGFFAYLSLIKTDTAILAQAWQNFAYSLLESLPAAALTILCFSISLFLISLRSSIQKMTRAHGV